jgi:peptidoglycan/xylan/chitin deacetylase (PgdA/CDA1 family)
MRGQLVELDDSFRGLFRESTVDHDIGAHGYSHREFTSLTAEEAEDELSKIQTGMRKIGVAPKSFVFPKNSVAYLDLLEKYGYKCYRSRGGLARDNMFISKEGALFDIHPSLYIDKDANPQMLKKILDIAVTRRLPFHIWFHLWDFGQNKNDISKCASRILGPLLHYAKKRERSGSLTCATMLMATNSVKTDF